MDELINWAEQIGCAVTICDKECNILYMNERSRTTFASHGDMIGKNLMECHPEHAKKKILEMLATGRTNAYTIDKKGQKKLIYQTPWRKNDEIAGLVEFSIVLPPDMPHFIR
ncbi:MAG: PAS domain-containing protein [Muribaculum sp.]|nr:PAS domain-containing protein [Muribaculum sp.]